MHDVFSSVQSSSFTPLMSLYFRRVGGRGVGREGELRVVSGSGGPQCMICAVLFPVRLSC